VLTRQVLGNLLSSIALLHLLQGAHQLLHDERRQLLLTRHDVELGPIIEACHSHRVSEHASNRVNLLSVPLLWAAVIDVPTCTCDARVSLWEWCAQRVNSGVALNNSQAVGQPYLSYVQDGMQCAAAGSGCDCVSKQENGSDHLLPFHYCCQ
jgi:hypothetical protein